MTLALEEKKTRLDENILFGLPVVPEIMFTNHKDKYKEGIEKRQTKLLEKMDFLKPFLQEGEVIFLVTRGCSPVSFTEQFLTGWIVFYLRRSLFVFTNRRILHIPTKMDFTYRNSIAQIRYGDCEDIKMKGRTLEVRYRDGKKEKFIYMDGKERKKLKALLKVLPLQDAAGGTGRRTHLCPRCAKELVELVPACPNCGLEFLTTAEGRRLSIIYPGGGFFYTRHPWLGISDALFETYLIIMAGVVAASAVKGDGEAVTSLVFFAILISFEKALTIYHTNNFLKEFIPKEKTLDFQGFHSRDDEARPNEIEGFE